MLQLKAVFDSHIVECLSEAFLKWITCRYLGGAPIAWSKKAR